MANIFISISMREYRGPSLCSDFWEDHTYFPTSIYFCLFPVHIGFYTIQNSWVNIKLPCISCAYLFFLLLKAIGLHTCESIIHLRNIDLENWILALNQYSILQVIAIIFNGANFLVQRFKDQLQLGVHFVSFQFQSNLIHGRSSRAIQV